MEIPFQCIDRLYCLGELWAWLQILLFLKQFLIGKNLLVWFFLFVFHHCWLVYGSFSHSIEAFESGFFLNIGNLEPFFAELKMHLDCSYTWCIFQYHNKKQYGESPVSAVIPWAECLRWAPPWLILAYKLALFSCLKREIWSAMYLYAKVSVSGSRQNLVLKLHGLLHIVIPESQRSNWDCFCLGPR